jgi:hypothetical protein
MDKSGDSSELQEAAPPPADPPFPMTSSSAIFPSLILGKPSSASITMLKHAPVIRFAILLFCFRVQATGAGFWLVPNGDDSDLTQTFPADTPLDLSWSGQPALSSFTNFDNSTSEQDLFNLFVTGFQPGSKYSELIAGRLHSPKYLSPTNH